VGRTYSDRGQLATLAYDGTTIDTRAYDDGGRMTSSSYNNGVSESRTYNDDNTLAGISFTGAAIGNLTYGWDANKNKTSESIGGTMSGYGFDVGGNGYDSEDRLVNWERSDSNLDQSWNLSLVGDWTSITENATSQNRTHGPTHELVSVASQSVTHDAKGNMTLIPAVLRGSSQTPTQPLKMKWDFENKLLAADIDNDNTDDVFYKFDALGRRVARTASAATMVYFQSGQQTIADYTAGTAASSPSYNYVYASYIDEPVIRSTGSSGAKHYFHRNQQYSTSAITDGSAAVVERYAYSAYGTPTITDASGTTRTTTGIGNRYTYTGREWDETLALYHYRARMYDSVGGRFVARDPIIYKSGHCSLYGYVKSMPLILIDSDGLHGRTPSGNPPYRPPYTGPRPRRTNQNEGLCGILVMRCLTGVKTVLVFSSDLLPGLLLGETGCVSTPAGIMCNGGCQEIKEWDSGDNDSRDLLDHEACHMCTLFDNPCWFAPLAYLGTWGGAPDPCVGSERETTPLW
jgi:RHS repeat-associated protein